MVSEFPGLCDARRILEAGCGTGNSAFPLIESLPLAHIYACDFAPNAVSLVQKHPSYKEGRVEAFVADLTVNDLTQWIKPKSLDACLLIFVLSAVSPEAMVTALANVAQVLKPGVGQVFFRDYAAGDLAEMRFAAGEDRQQHLGGRFFARSDGTRAFYFEKSSVSSLFEQAGFDCNLLKILERDQVNRMRAITMKRKFCQGVFTVRVHNDIHQEFRWIPFDVAAKNQRGASLTNEEIVISDLSTCNMEAVIFDCGSLKLQLDIPQVLHAQYAHTIVTEKSLATLVWFELDSVLLNTRVLLFGCGPYALAGFASLRWSRRVLALDYIKEHIDSLRRNAIANGSKVAFERLRIQWISERRQISRLIIKGLEGPPDVLLLTISDFGSINGSLTDVEEVLGIHTRAKAVVAVHGSIKDQFMAVVTRFNFEILSLSGSLACGGNVIAVYLLRLMISS